MKVLLLGGDKKQLYTADYLKDAGLDIYTCGFEKYGIMRHKCVSVDKIPEFSTIILPLPTSKDSKTVFMPYSEHTVTLQFIENNCKDCRVLGGNIELKHPNYTDYYKSEKLTMLNAVPSAEGALQCAFENSEITLFASKCLIIGNGRIGKILSDRLRGLKADVTVSARKEGDLAFITANGAKAILTQNLKSYIHEFDFIFNTVPHLVLTKDVITRCKSDALIIDLASKPGGTDFTAAENLKIKAIHALALPSKVAPKTAAKFIADTITDYLNLEKTGENI